MKKLFNKLHKHNLTISFAESMTAGYLSYSIAKNSGASNVLIGSIVAYNTNIKLNILKVKKILIISYFIQQLFFKIKHIILHTNLKQMIEIKILFKLKI